MNDYAELLYNSRYFLIFLITLIIIDYYIFFSDVKMIVLDLVSWIKKLLLGGVMTIEKINNWFLELDDGEQENVLIENGWWDEEQETEEQWLNLSDEDKIYLYNELKEEL